MSNAPSHLIDADAAARAIIEGVFSPRPEYFYDGLDTDETGYYDTATGVYYISHKGKLHAETFDKGTAYVDNYFLNKQGEWELDN
jgi:hypothetical protein